MADDKKPAEPETPPMSERDLMLAKYMHSELQRRVKLASVRTPAGLAGLFPGLGKKRK